MKLRQRYRKAVRASSLAQRWRPHPKRRREAQRGVRRLKTIVGRLVRELERKLPAAVVAAQAENFARYRKVLAQQPKDAGKIYGLHEPAHLLRGQRQGAQKLRIRHQGLAGADQNQRRPEYSETLCLSESQRRGSNP